MFRSPSLFLFSFFVVACAPAPGEFELSFAASWGGTPISCDTAGERGRLQDLRFFVSDLTLLAPDGTATAVELGRNGRWQGSGVTLIDLENGAGDCANGTPDVNPRVVGQVPENDYSALRFTIGVPFDVNHADPLRAPVPLNDSTMHWHWRSGYQFLRTAGDGPEGAFRLHLGSAGCTGSIGHIRDCRFPNRARVEIADWHPGETIQVDLRTLAEAGVRPDGETAVCESGPADPSCALLFPVLGLDPGSGAPAFGQSLFHVPKP